MIATLVQLMGEDKAFDYMKGLHPTSTAYTRSGTGADQGGGARRDRGVDQLRPRRPGRGDAGLPGGDRDAGRRHRRRDRLDGDHQGRAQPRNAKKFYEWALTPQAQQFGAAAQAVPAAVATRRRRSARRARTSKKIKLIDYDYAKYGASAERKRLIARWEKEVNSLPRTAEAAHATQRSARAAGAGRPRAWLAAFGAALVPCRRASTRGWLRAACGRRRTRRSGARRRSLATAGRGCRSALAGARRARRRSLLPATRARQAALLAGRRRHRPGAARGAAFAIGCTGWSFDLLGARLRRAAAGQLGIGTGGAVVLVALLMLLAPAWRGSAHFRGDLFVAGAVGAVAALLLLFVALPSCASCVAAFSDDAARFRRRCSSSGWRHERIWGLGCLSGGGRCGVAWNTLFLALLTAPARPCSA